MNHVDLWAPIQILFQGAYKLSLEIFSRLLKKVYQAPSSTRFSGESAFFYSGEFKIVVGLTIFFTPQIQTQITKISGRLVCYFSTPSFKLWTLGTFRKDGSNLKTQQLFHKLNVSQNCVDIFSQRMVRNADFFSVREVPFAKGQQQTGESSILVSHQLLCWEAAGVPLLAFFLFWLRFLSKNGG